MNIKAFATTLLTTLVLIIIYHFVFNTKKYSLAYVDSSKLMTSYKEMNKANELIITKEKAWQTSLDTLALELQNDIKKYEKERSKMSDREKQTTEELLNRKQQQFMQYKEATKNRATEENQKITSEVFSKINSVITEYGKAHHYTMIFGTISGNIVYADEAINVTDDILQELNK